jgi:hypothetical protein
MATESKGLVGAVYDVNTGMVKKNGASSGTDWLGANLVHLPPVRLIALHLSDLECLGDQTYGRNVTVYVSVHCSRRAGSDLASGGKICRLHSKLEVAVVGRIQFEGTCRPHA